VDGTIAFDYLVDVYGTGGFDVNQIPEESTLHRVSEEHRRVGVLDGVGSYGEGTTRAIAPWFEALTGMDLILKPAYQ